MALEQWFSNGEVGKMERYEKGGGIIRSSLPSLSFCLCRSHVWVRWQAMRTLREPQMVPNHQPHRPFPPYSSQVRIMTVFFSFRKIIYMNMSREKVSGSMLTAVIFVRKIGNSYFSVLYIFWNFSFVEF